MNTSKLNHVPLGQASLCMDCDTITASHTRCLICGSVALLNVAKALNGDEYADPLQMGITPMASIPAQRAHQSRVMYTADARMQMNHRPIGEPLTFPHIRPSISDQDGADSYGWLGSFREVAAIVHRAMTIVIFAVLTLGVSVKGH